MAYEATAPLLLGKGNRLFSQALGSLGPDLQILHSRGGEMGDGVDVVSLNPPGEFVAEMRLKQEIFPISPRSCCGA